jgi:protein-disulfide isomerase
MPRPSLLAAPVRVARPATRLATRPAARRVLVAALLAAASVAGACRAKGEERPTPAATQGASAGGAATSASDGALGAAGAATGAGADSTALRAAADSGRIVGAPSAKVWLIIASDFQCPYCRMWHDESFAALKREYVDAGKVRMAFLNFPLPSHRHAMPTAEAGMCAATQRRFWEFHSALFETQEQWSRAADATPAIEAAAGKVGLDLARFRACRTSGVMRALVEADRDRMERAGVNSTPSFFVGRTAIAGAQPLPVFRAALDSALAASATATR